MAGADAEPQDFDRVETLRPSLWRAAVAVGGVAATIAIVLLTLEVVRLRGLAPGVASDGLAQGSEVPAVDLALVATGEVVSLKEEVREAKLVYFFTTTCPYCVASLPGLDRLRMEVPSVDLVGVALDGVPAARAYAAAHGISWRLLAAPTPAVAAALQVRRVPTLVLYDDGQRVARAWTGELGESVVLAIADEVESASHAQ